MVCFGGCVKLHSFNPDIFHLHRTHLCWTPSSLIFYYYQYEVYISWHTKIAPCLYSFFQDCYNNFPQSECFKMTEMYYPTVLKTRTLKSWCVEDHTSLPALMLNNFLPFLAFCEVFVLFAILGVP